MKPKNQKSHSSRRQIDERSFPRDAGGPESGLIERILELVQSARRSISRSADMVQVQTCFEIGRHIVEFEQGGQERAVYGAELLKKLAVRLTCDLGRGFSQSNLEYMRRFFLEYAHLRPISQIGSGQSSPIGRVAGQAGEAPLAEREAGFRLGWSHYVFLLSIRNLEERRFYEIEAANSDWTLKELKRQYDSSLYERLAMGRDPEGRRRLAQEGQTIGTSRDLLKEPLVLEFLGLHEHSVFSETELETAIICQIEQFLLELGKGFLFEARQRRLTFGADHFFVDLVFYNRLLRCYVQRWMKTKTTLPFPSSGL